jgi:hypothetical protein
MVSRKKLLKILEGSLIALFLSSSLSLARAETADQNDPCQNYADANQKASCEKFVSQYKVPSPPPPAQTETTETKSEWGFKSEQPKRPPMPGIIPAPQNPLAMPQQPISQNTITPIFTITAPSPNNIGMSTQKPTAKNTPLSPTPIAPSAAPLTPAETPPPSVAKAVPAQPKSPTQFFDQGQTSNQTRQSIYQ